MTSSSPLVTTPKVTIPRLDRDIIKRGRELVGTPEKPGLDSQAREKTEDRYQGLPEFARPRVDTNSGKLRQPGTLLDPLNVLGSRQKIIDKIVEQGGQGLIDSYVDGKYGGLSGWNRTLDGITDDDITKGILRRNEKLRNKDPELSADIDVLEGEGIETNSLTTNTSIKQQAQNFRDIKVLETNIREMEGGTEALKALGDKPTKAQLESLKTELKPKQTEEIRAGEIHDSNLKTAESNRDNVESQITNREGTLALANLQERNRNAISRAEIDFKNNTNEYNYKTAQADRELKKELALLGFEDKASERKYDREERRDQNRQLLILQMMKGLQNLGSGFAL